MAAEGLLDSMRRSQIRRLGTGAVGIQRYMGAAGGRLLKIAHLPRGIMLVAGKGNRGDKSFSIAFEKLLPGTRNPRNRRQCQSVEEDWL